MKKNISYINLDASFTKWIYKKIKDEAVEGENKQELLSGLSELIMGETNSLMLGMSEEIKDFTDISINEIIIGDIKVYPKSRKVFVKQEEALLTPKEYDILYFLIQNRGEVFTKEQIYRAVWDEEFLLADSNIMAFIRKLRKKIEPNPDSPEYIITIWGIGYMFADIHI